MLETLSCRYRLELHRLFISSEADLKRDILTITHSARFYKKHNKIQEGLQGFTNAVKMFKGMRMNGFLRYIFCVHSIRQESQAPSERYMNTANQHYCTDFGHFLMH